MEYIDEHAVVSYRIRFRDRAEISEEHAATIRDGAIMAWLVRAECLPPSYHAVTRDSEDRYRFNIQAVQDVLPLVGEQREAALVYLASGGDQGYLAFDAPRLSEAGLYDPRQHRDAERELTAVRHALSARGLLKPEESMAECLERILPAVDVAAPAVSSDPEPAPSDGPEYHEDHAAWQRRQLPEFESRGVEVVGSIYAHGKSDDRRLIEEAFET